MNIAHLLYSKMRWETQDRCEAVSPWVAFADSRVHYCLGGQVLAVGLIQMNAAKFHLVQTWERTWWHEMLT